MFCAAAVRGGCFQSTFRRIRRRIDSSFASAIVDCRKPQSSIADARSGNGRQRSQPFGRHHRQPERQDHRGRRPTNRNRRLAKDFEASIPSAAASSPPLRGRCHASHPTHRKAHMSFEADSCPQPRNREFRLALPFGYLSFIDLNRSLRGCCSRFVGAPYCRSISPILIAHRY